MKTNSKILAVVMALIMIIGLAPISAFTAHAADAGTFTELQQMIDNLEDTFGVLELELEKDYEYEDGFSVDGIVVPAGKQVTICLNGHTIDGGGKARVFWVEGELALIGPGTITGGKAEEGGGVFVDETAMLELNNVEISGNAATTSGGGVYLDVDGNLAIGGKTVVFGNTRGDGGTTTADNVYLNGPRIEVASPLTDGAKIGLTPNKLALSAGEWEGFGNMMPLVTGFNTQNPGADAETFFVSDDPEICIGNPEIDEYDQFDLFCSIHTHEMEYRKVYLNPREDADCLWYVCKNADGLCLTPAPRAQLTLHAPNRAYNGKVYADAWLDDLEQFNQITGLSLSLVREEDGYENLQYISAGDSDIHGDPIAPGSYVAEFEAEINGHVYHLRKTFAITPAPLTITPKTQFYTYNGEVQGPGDLLYAGSDAEAAVEAVGLAEGDYVASVTLDGQGKDAGTYELVITGYDIKNADGYGVGGNYTLTTETGTLVIEKKPLTPGLTMDGWTVGEAASAPVLTGNEGGGDVTYAYKPQGADDAAYSPDVPTAAGDYTVRATVAETENHLGGEKTADFTIRPAPPTGILLDSSNAKREYEEGDALDVSGLVLTAQYSDGSEKEIPVTEEMVSGFDNQTPGKQILTVSCEGLTATYEIEVKAKPAPPTYDAKDSSGNTIQSVTWQKGSGKTLDLTIHRNEDDDLTYGLFDSLEIGGVTVGSTNYGAAEGSLQLSIKPEYLETLDLGDHTVKINFRDGSATVKLTVLAAATQPPKTGDESNLTLHGSLMLMSVAAMVVLLLYGRKSKTEK